MYKSKPLGKKEILYIDNLSRLANVAESDKYAIFSIDMRDQLDVSNILEFDVGFKAQKTLLFLVKITSLMFDNKVMNLFIEKNIIPSMAINKETLKDILYTAECYCGAYNDIYSFIYETEKNGKKISDNSSRSHPGKCLFLYDDFIISEVGIQEKEYCIIRLISLMMDDNLIDEREQQILDMIDDYFGTETASYVNYEATINDIRNDSIQPTWIIHSIIFFYLCSVTNLQKDHRAQLFDQFLATASVSHDFIYKKIIPVIQRFIDINIKAYDLVSSEQFSGECKAVSQMNYLKIISTSLDIFTDFIPGVTSLKKAKSVYQGVQTAARTGGIVLGGRDESIMEFGLADIEYQESTQVVICIDGFLSELSQDQFSDWHESLHNLGIQHWIQGYRWPSYNLKYAANDFGTGGISELLGASWYQSIENAAGAGKRLAHEMQLIQKYKPEIKFTLLGHSLGSRVILNTLVHLHGTGCVVEEAYLLGGAVSRIDKVSWAAAMHSVSKNIYNFYSKNDMVLTRAYQIAQGGDKPVGLGPIEYMKNKDFNLCTTYNVDVSDFILGHMEYKNNLAKILKNTNMDFGILCKQTADVSAV